MHKFDTKRGEPIRILLERFGGVAATVHIQHFSYGDRTMVAVEVRDSTQQRLGSIDCSDVPTGYVEAFLYRFFMAVVRSDDQSDATHAAYVVAGYRAQDIAPHAAPAA